MTTIKTLRRSCGMTQKELSDFLGIPKRSIENWESGERKPPEYLISLIEYKLKGEGLL